MRKLLSANFARLWKDKTFWLGAGFMLALALYVVLNKAFSDPAANTESFDALSFGYSQILGFCCAVFATMFLGTDYSDGTLRNRIIVGHSRARIYLANLITVFSAALLMTAAWLAGTLVGFLFFGPWANLPGCLVNFLASLFTTAAFSAIFTLVAMLCTSKAVSAVSSMLLFLGLSAFAGSISYESVRDFLPTGHALWIAGDSAGGSVLTLPASVPVTLFGSVVITAAVTVVGILLFQKKDLK